MAEYGISWDTEQPTGEKFPAGVRSEIGALIGALIGAQTTRTGTFSFDLPHTNGSSWPNQPFTTRRLFAMTQDALRFRVHFRNRDQLANLDITGTLTDVQFYVGEPLMEGGVWAGGIVGTPFVVQSPTSVASGTELISPWIDADAYTLAAGKTYVLSQGLQVSASGAMAHSGEPSFQGFTATAAAESDPVLERADNVSWGHAWIEFEYGDDDAPHILVVSNSLAMGATTGALNNGTLSSAFQRWALANDGIVSSLAMSGGWAGHFDAPGARWNVYDTTETPITPGVVIYFALNSSDLIGGNLADAKANLLEALAVGTAKWPDARHYVTNVPPRSEITDDTDRLALNEWMHLLTWNPLVDGVLDVDSLLSDYASPARIRPPLTSEGIHLTPQGHQVVVRSFTF